jgi:hypothetical protein
MVLGSGEALLKPYNLGPAAVRNVTGELHVDSESGDSQEESNGSGDESQTD